MIELLPSKQKVILFGADISYILSQIEQQGGNQLYVELVKTRVKEILIRNDLLKVIPPNIIPPKQKVIFLGDDVNFLIIKIEMQGGNRHFVHTINKRIDEVMKRQEMD